MLALLGAALLGVSVASWPTGADDAAPTTATGTESGQTPAETTASSEAALELLHDARQRLFNHTSVRAEIREFVVLGDYRFQAEGTYIAGPFNPLPQLRLEYEVRVGNTVGNLLEICDGQILRTQRTIKRVDAPAEGDDAKPEVSVTRRDVRKILDAVHKHGATPETVLQAELGIGGLPALLTSIERAMIFGAVREEPLAGRPCYLLEGRWKPEFLSQLEQQFQIFGREVQPYLPEFVRIHLDQETLFPVRITYWPPVAAEGPAHPPMLTLEFTDIRLNEPVSPLLFEFVASSASETSETDVTEQFIEAIKSAAPPQAPAAPSQSPSAPGPASP